MAPRTAKTLILLNIYDLSDANQYTLPIGLGFFHSGVEVGGEEFSFASGAGIFSSTPKEASGARFRESIEMGYFEGTYSDAKRLAHSLRSEFEGDSYNLLTKNCNSFADAFCQLLLNRPIPAYINRAAYFGSFLSCLLPNEMTGTAPVGDTSSSNSALLGGGKPGYYTPFAGSGQTLGGGSSSSSTSKGGAAPSSEAELRVRRENVRLAALKRIENQSKE